MAAYEHEPIEGCEALRGRLTERCACGGGYDDRAPFAGIRLARDRIERARYRFGAQNHPRSAAIGPVVGAFALVETIEQIVQADLDQAALLCAAHDRKADRRSEHLREERDDVDE